MSVTPKNLTHIDIRLGHVAIDMGLMTKEQVDKTWSRVGLARAGSNPAVTFGAAATQLGYVSRQDLDRIEAEEMRRRRLISGYEIIDNLGSGTISTVYRARQLSMDRDVALKILHPRLAEDPEFIKRYLDDARAVSRFHHPNIVQGFDSGESNGFYYFGHEYLSGGSLADRLPRLASGEERFSENRLLLYLRQTTAGLKYAWLVGVYHGDINPGNLFLDGQGSVKLANLGVPRVANPTGGGNDAARAFHFVRAGPDYAAPEQVENPELVNARTDIYSLGATFYHISFGVPPFHGGDRRKVLEYRARNPMPPFSLKSQEGYSGTYLRLIHDMLELDPEKRPADPDELADRLGNFHIAGTDELSGLARQVRQVVGPAVASVREHSRSRSPAPVPDGCDRGYSLLPKRGNLAMRRDGYWVIAIAAAAAAALAAAILC